MRSLRTKNGAPLGCSEAVPPLELRSRLGIPRLEFVEDGFRSGRRGQATKKPAHSSSSGVDEGKTCCTPLAMK